MNATDLLNPIARCLLASVFIFSGASKILWFDRTPTMFESVEVVIELLGGLAFLSGFKTRYAAASLIFVVAIMTLTQYTPFTLHGIGRDQVVNVLMNLAVIGGLLKFVAEGSGPIALDSRRRRKEITF